MRLRNDEARMKNDDSEISATVIFPMGAGASRKAACPAGAAVYIPRFFRAPLASNLYKPLNKRSRVEDLSAASALALRARA